MIITKKQLSQVFNHNFTKELKDLEYETKFNIKNKNLNSLEVLDRVRLCFKNNTRFILCKIRGGDKLLTTVEFFMAEGVEYSIFKYHGAKMVKVKKHHVVKTKPFSIFRNDESLIIDRDDFNQRLASTRHRFKRHNYRLTDLNKFLEHKSLFAVVGKMTKERVKDFVVDVEDGRIYAVAVTFCKTKNKIQKQLEIEYAGYLPGLKMSKHNSEKQVMAGTLRLSEYIYNDHPKMFEPSTERKFEFVKRNNA